MCKYYKNNHRWVEYDFNYSTYEKYGPYSYKVVYEDYICYYTKGLLLHGLYKFEDGNFYHWKDSKLV